MTKDSHASLAHYIDRLGLPHACISTVSLVYTKMDARLWVIENSYAMQKRDSKLLKATANFERIERKDNVSRWSELSQCIDFHSKMAARCWIPTKYWLVNDPENKSLPKRFGLCWGKEGDVAGELEQVHTVMKDLTLDSKVNPLGRQLQKIERYLSKEASRLEENDEYVGVVVCTQGVPTDERGNKGQDVIKDFVKNLVSLSEMPVKIVFRLCTDNDQVVDFYNTLDINDKCACDVLDDFWGEAYEVYLHNPWLTYGIGIHRLREAGLGTELMDELDEKSLSLDEIHEFCTEFFIGDKDIPLSNPCHDFPGFVKDLEKILLKEKLAWNPCKKKLCPWIDVEKLRTMFRRASVTGVGMGKRVSYCRAPPSTGKVGGMGGSRRGRDAPAAFQRGASVHAASQTPKPQAFQRSHTAHPSQPSRQANSMGGRSQSNAGQTQNTGVKKSAGPGPKDLTESIQRWSHQPPDYKRLNPMGTLLVTVPTLFPATNDFVEDHEYFDKWKEFSEDAFAGETGDDLKNLLTRAARKAKFFLHPDKLPNDLTEAQTTLFKSIWDVIQDSEAKTLA